MRGYTIYRRNRDSSGSRKARGGGVLIAIKSNLSSSEVQNNSPHIEHLFVSVSINHCKYVIGATYLPPLSNILSYLTHAREIEDIRLRYPSHHYILFGDYNLPKILWNNDIEGVTHSSEPTTTALTTEAAQILCDSFAFMNLYQLNNLANNCGNILDLCFSNSKDDKIQLVNEPLIPCDTFHQAFIYHTNTISQDTTMLNYEEHILDYKKANYETISQELAGIQWQTTFSEMSISESVAAFYSIIQRICLQHIPVIARYSTTYPRWFSAELKRHIVLKTQAHKKFKKTRLKDDYTSFANLRVLCKQLSEDCYRKYITQVESSLCDHGQVKSFWAYINASKKEIGLPQEMVLDDRKANYTSDKVNLFADFFKSVYTDEKLSSTNIPQRLDPLTTPHINIELEDIRSEIKKTQTQPRSRTRWCTTINRQAMRTCNFTTFIPPL